MKNKIIVIVIVVLLLMGLVVIFGKEWAHIARTFLRELFRSIF